MSGMSAAHECFIPHCQLHMASTCSKSSNPFSAHHGLVCMSAAQYSLCHAQDPNFRMLPALGIAAVGCTSNASFTQSDADRFTALTHLTSSVPESLDPILLPPSRPTPAPLGPISYNTLSAQQHPSAASLHAERQHSGSLAGNHTASTGSRGRPAKEPKLSGMRSSSM